MKGHGMVGRRSADAYLSFLFYRQENGISETLLLEKHSLPDFTFNRGLFFLLLFCFSLKNFFYFKNFYFVLVYSRLTML